VVRTVRNLITVQTIRPVPDPVAWCRSQSEIKERNLRFEIRTPPVIPRQESLSENFNLRLRSQNLDTSKSRDQSSAASSSPLDPLNCS